MSRYSTQPPWEFLLNASKISLQSYELSRLACAANLRKEVATLLDQWLEETALAMLARLLIQQRDEPPKPGLHALAGELCRPQGAHTASYNVFPDAAVSPPVSGGND